MTTTSATATPIIGIDLGTTNSVVAVLERGRPRAIEVDGAPVMPSVVHYAADGRVVVGRAARNLAVAHPEQTVASVKRKMGRAATLDVGGRARRPEEISAEILRALKAAAEQDLGHPVTRAVITVPAYFDDAQRRATLAAGELAGLEVLRLLNEPTAASLLYDRPEAPGATGDAPEIMLVYDLGGGTFDVSVIEVVAGVREVRSSAGNSALGGDDFDECLLHRFVNTVRMDHGVDPTSDVVAMARLRRAAEQTKIALSREVEVSVREEFLMPVGGTPVHFETVVTRRELEDLIDELLESTIALAHRALDEAKLGPGEVLARICLVGGSTRIPKIHALLANSFAADIHVEIDPDLAVGLGAALQSGLLQGEAVQRVLVDVASHTLGIRTADSFGEDGDADAFSPILRRNCALPAERTEEFYTSVDAQEIVRIEVLQGESPRASRNRLVGEFEFPLRPVPPRSPVWIRFAYDLDGVIRVTASQPGGESMTVHLDVADAAPGRRAAPSSGSDADADAAAVVPRANEAAVARRARALLTAADGLTAVSRAALAGALLTYDLAPDDERRAAAEDALLDLILDLEGG